jgi:ribosome maturation factor RimP
MINTEQIISILDELIDKNLHFIVDVKASSSKIRKKITVLIDTDAGIGIDECSKISKSLALRLDELIEDAYTLEVSSPGVDTPLLLTRQYLKNIGKNLKVITKEGIEIKGELISSNETEIIILPEKKKKEKTMPAEVKLAFEDIKEARVQVSFN